MLHNDYPEQVCNIASALEVVGERWSLLIVRDIMLGLRRFDELQAELGVARNVLQSRLTRLVEQGVVAKRLYQERPPRYEYRLTEMGFDLWPTMLALMRWGDRHAPRAEDGPPVLVEHLGCGGKVDDHRVCERCGARLTVRDVRALPGPGIAAEHPLLQAAARRAADDAPAAA